MCSTQQGSLTVIDTHAVSEEYNGDNVNRVVVCSLDVKTAVAAVSNWLFRRLCNGTQVRHELGVLKPFDSNIRPLGHLVLTSSTDVESSPVDQGPVSRSQSPLTTHVDPASIPVSPTVVFPVVSSIIKPVVSNLDTDLSVPPANVHDTMTPFHESQLVESDKSKSSSPVVVDLTADNVEYIQSQSGGLENGENIWLKSELSYNYESSDMQQDVEPDDVNTYKQTSVLQEEADVVEN
jgi:hypothetical protein